MTYKEELDLTLAAYMDDAENRDYIMDALHSLCAEITERICDLSAQERAEIVDLVEAAIDILDGRKSRDEEWLKFTETL